MGKHLCRVLFQHRALDECFLHSEAVVQTESHGAQKLASFFRKHWQTPQCFVCVCLHSFASLSADYVAKKLQHTRHLDEKYRDDNLHQDTADSNVVCKLRNHTVHGKNSLHTKTTECCLQYLDLAMFGDTCKSKRFCVITSCMHDEQKRTTDERRSCAKAKPVQNIFSRAAAGRTPKQINFRIWFNNTNTVLCTTTQLQSSFKNKGRRTLKRQLE